MGNTNKSKDNSDINQLAADNVQTMISKTLSGLNLNSSNSNISSSKNSKNISVSYPDHSEELDMFPIELWNEILLLVEDKSLAKIVPLVSRLLYHFTSQDSDIWKQKCDIKFKESLETKPKDRSWKQFYFLGGTTKFFPLFGFTIGETSYSQLRSTKGAVAKASGESRYVTFNDVNFWVHSSSVFTSMYIVHNIYVIPKEWEEKGLTWEKSFNEYKEWCKKTFGNYRVTEQPHDVEFQAQPCFTALIETTAKEQGDAVYIFKLKFGYKRGDVHTNGTLHSITVVSYKELNQTKESFEQRFNERKCED